MEFTSHNSSAILEPVANTMTSLTEPGCWLINRSDEDMFPRDHGHRSRNSMVAAVVWLTVTEYLFHRWKRICSLYIARIFPFPPDMSFTGVDDRHGGCLIRNRRCLLYRCTWSHLSFCRVHVGHLSIAVLLVIVSFLSVCVFLLFWYCHSLWIALFVIDGLISSSLA